MPTHFALSLFCWGSSVKYAEIHMGVAWPALGVNTHYLQHRGERENRVVQAATLRRAALSEKAKAKGGMPLSFVPYFSDNVSLRHGDRDALCLPCLALVSPSLSPSLSLSLSLLNKSMRADETAVDKWPDD